MKIRLMLITLLISMGLFSTANANLQLQLTQGISAAVPIAIVPFAGQDNSKGDPNNIAATVQNDLRNSGRFTVMENGKIQQTPSNTAAIDFNYWKQTGNEYMVIGNIQSNGSNYQVTFSLVNVLAGQTQQGQSSQNPVVFNKVYNVSRDQLRAAAHKISDEVYKQITGIPGIFSTRVAYVLVQGNRTGAPKYILEVADADGFNPRPLLISSEPIMSPSWAPSGNQIAYVSFANQQASIFVVNVANGQQKLISEFPGINGAPSWSPDGTQLAVVLSKSGSPKIYTYNLGTGNLRQLTTGDSIDTEPNWAPDGQSIVFTSNRGGGPQVYRLALGSGKIQRVTFDGNYNATGRFTDGGQSLVILHQESGGYNIAVQDLASGGLTMITRDGYDSSPSVAPNGQMVIYANNRNQKGTLGIVSIDGKIQLALPAPEGTVEEPAWSPYLG